MSESLLHVRSAPLSAPPSRCVESAERSPARQWGTSGAPLLRQFADRQSGSLSYLLLCPRTREALLIDPVAEDALLYLGVIDEMGGRLVRVIDTHLHSDHRSASAALCGATGALAVAGRCAGIAADIRLDDGDTLPVGRLRLIAAHTPGHTAGCLSFQLGDRWFTGDCLVPGDGGATDEPDSDPARLFDTVRRVFVPLPDETLFYPGRLKCERRVGCLGEERGRNPLFSGLSRDEFVSRRLVAPRPATPAAAALIAVNRQGGAPISDSLRIPQ